MNGAGQHIAKRHPAPWAARNCCVLDARGRVVCSAADQETARELAAFMAAGVIEDMNPPAMVLPGQPDTGGSGDISAAMNSMAAVMCCAVVGVGVVFWAWWCLRG